MSHANYITAADAFASWQHDVLTGTPPTFYPIAGSGDLARLEIGPGLVTLFGGAPATRPSPCRP
jgi:replicative DNA helicase